MFLDIPQRDGVWYFYPQGITTQFTGWVKPQEYNSFIIIGISGGGGGGGGQSGAVGTDRSGGGGGGAGSYLIAHVPAILLPEMLYISVGRGGNGGGAASNGGSGTATVISYRPFASAGNQLFSLGAGAGGGSGGSGGGGGNNFASIIASIICPANIVAGTFGNTGAGQSSPAYSFILGGAGGGASSQFITTQDGGGVTNSAFTQTIIPGGVAPGGNGNSGYVVNKPLTLYPGTGGAANPSGVGGRGGDGAFGCGGGGGGAGVTGGAGGRGGDGIVIIIGL